jgi:hypothetical protein
VATEQQSAATQDNFTMGDDTSRLHSGQHSMATSQQTVAGWHLDGFFDAGVNE